MSLLKYINRLKQIDHLIKNENTGPADEFAKRVGISRSMLMINLSEMRALGAEITYCPHKRSYCYIREFHIIIGNVSKSKIMGGRQSYISQNIKNFLASPMVLDTRALFLHGKIFTAMPKSVT